MFALVQFSMTNKLTIVPVSWINGKYCFWPNSKDILKLAKTRQSPKTDWSCHEIVIEGIYVSYDEAQQKLEGKSNIDSEEVFEKGKRSRKGSRSPLKGDSSEEQSVSYNFNLPMETGEQDIVPIKTGEQDNVQQDTISCSPAVSIFIEPKLEPPDEEFVGTESCQASSSQSEKSKEKSTTVQQLAHLQEQQLTLLHEVYNLKPAEEFTIATDNCKASSGQLEKSKEKCIRVHQLAHLQEQQSTLLHEVYNLKLILKKQSEIMSSTLNALNSFLEKSGSTGSEVPLPVQLPLKTYEDFMKFEKELDDERTQKKLFEVIAKTGGLNLGNMVRRMLCRLITNELAMEFSWLGTKEKKSFCSYKLTHILLSAIKQSPLYENSTESKVEIVIKDWLRHAKARSNYKKDQ